MTTARTTDLTVTAELSRLAIPASKVDQHAIAARLQRTRDQHERWNGFSPAPAVEKQP